MPFLHEFGKQNTIFTNYWSTSHCTDASITPMLTGKWPDELRLYSMMYETDWDLPQDVKMLAQTAKQHDYNTGMITNLGRWYQRGVDHFVNNRGWHGSDTFSRVVQMTSKLPQPWFLTVHDDSCHTNYRGGSYDRACLEVDTDLMRLVGAVLGNEQLKNNTFVFITSDHGEGLGQHGIQQHGFGLWPELTHVPLIARFLEGPDGTTQPLLHQHIDLYRFMAGYITGEWHEDLTHSRKYAHLVGRVPNCWHRAVTDGKLLIIKEQYTKGSANPVWNFVDLKTGREDKRVDNLWKHPLWDEARKHAAQFGIDADDDGKSGDAILEERLRSLGYFD